MEFVVLPDRPLPATEGLRHAARRLDHPSGRPWIVGDWDPGEVEVVAAGDRRAAVLGAVRPRGVLTSSELARAGSPHALDAVAARAPGAFHLVASLEGHCRVQGSLTGLHQVFTAEVSGAPVAAGSVTALLRYLDLVPEIDDTLLAARLLSPAGAPWPLAQRPVLRGFTPVLTGEWLDLPPSGGARTVRWWRPPPGDLDLEAGAARLATALADAVALRVAGPGPVSADLSGGLDSTAVCFLAAAAGGDLVTYHVAPLDRANRDTGWARAAAAALPAARHRCLDATRDENLFDVGYTRSRGRVAEEGPTAWASGLPHLQDLARRAAAEGASRHLTGFGGDELFGRIPACAWSLLRARPVTGARLVNRYRLANRWPLRATLAEVLDRSTFAGSLRRAAARVGAPPPPVDRPDLGWVFPVRMPPWATPDAVAAVADLLRATADTAPEPLDPDRTRHQVLASLVFEGTTLRHVNSVTRAEGVSWEAPFLDDRVVEAVLATAVDERLSPGRFKPLLAEAVRPLVPGTVLARQDKGEFSAETFAGLERHRDRLALLCEDSHLARRGLVDPAALRTGLLDPGPMSYHLQPIATTVACESWLRTHPVPHALPLEDPCH